MFARIGVMCALNRHHVREFNPSRKEHHWGGESSRGPMTVWVYVDTRKQVGDREHLKVFASEGRCGNLVRGKRSGRRCVRIRGSGVNRISRRTIMCMMVIAALAIIWNSRGH
jgi:hypothetical protein